MSPFLVKLSLLITFLLLSVAYVRIAIDGDQQTAISQLYGTWCQPLHHVLTHYKWPSVLAGKIADTRMSSWYVPRFIKNHALDVQEFEKPVSSFKTFNDFFTRKLTRKSRPLSLQERCVISPADGAVLVMHNITNATEFPLKGVTLSLEKLLQDTHQAKLFQGGTAFIIRLAPWDYHRLHFPLAGIPSASRIIHGRYESVNPFVYSCGVQPLEINERHVILYETEKASTVAFVLVGALFVGAIHLTYIPQKSYSAGDELGYFSFGGSTIVVLFKKNSINPSPEIIAHSLEGKETLIKMGQPLGYYV